MTWPVVDYSGLMERTKNSSLKTVSDDKRKVTISPLGLLVTGGEDERYWKIDKASGTILLHRASLLNVRGMVSGKDLTEGATYSVNFMVKMTADAFGWSGCPVFLAVWSEGKINMRESDLSQLRQDVVETIPDTGSADQNKMLKFTAPPQDQFVYFLMFETFERSKGTWKGGLEIIQVIIEKCG